MTFKDQLSVKFSVCLFFFNFVFIYIRLIVHIFLIWKYFYHLDLLIIYIPRSFFQNILQQFWFLKITHVIWLMIVFPNLISDFKWQNQTTLLILYSVKVQNYWRNKSILWSCKFNSWYSGLKMSRTCSSKFVVGRKQVTIPMISILHNPWTWNLINKKN